MAKVYGIDLGTTYSVIATLEDGKPEIIEDINGGSSGGRLLASVVYFPDGDNPVVGEVAKAQAEVEPQNVVQMIKRKIGKDSTPMDFHGEQYNPIKISSLILKRMVEYAKEKGHDVKNVVITCPAYFGIDERNATRQAGELAGLNVLNIVNEPTAAAFNYLSREIKESKTIMVYDLGGGTFDITLFEYTVEDSGKTLIDVVDSGGDDLLGGVDWDERLYEHIVECYINERGISREDIDSDGDLKQKIRSKVEATKIALSDVKNKKVSIAHDGEQVRMEISKEKFEELTKDLVKRTIDYVEALLSKNSYTPEQIDILLLVGGSTFMPMIREAVEKIFPDRVRFEDPNLAVAKGAAISAGIEYEDRRKELIKIIEEKPEEIDEILENPIFDSENKPKTIGDLENQRVEVPTNFDEGTTIKDRLSRSFGPQVVSDDDTYLFIDNMLYVGDEPSEETRGYAVRHGDTTIAVPIYENILPRDSATIIKLKDQNGVIEPDPSLLVKDIGKVNITVPLSDEDTPINLTIKARTGGLDVVAVNPKTGESFPASLNSEHTMTAKEMEKAKRKMEGITTSSE